MLLNVLLFLPLLFNNAENKRIFVTKMPGKWQVGESVKIEGTIHPKTWNVVINLQDGPGSENVDVGLQLSLRSGLRHFVLTSIQKDGNWREDSKVETDFPLTVKGCKTTFQAEIKAAKDQYEITVNDHKYTFPQQTGLDHLTHLLVEVHDSHGREATVTHIDWSMNENDDAACPAKTEESNDDLSSYLNYNQCQPQEVVTRSEIPGKWQMGESLKIQGTLSENFDITLQQGEKFGNTAVGLLISVKRGKLLLASIKDNKLIDPQIHEKDLPIDVTIGCKAPIEIEIKAVEDQCEISINNQKYSFPTQIQVDSLTHVLIGGDASIGSMDWSIDKNNKDLCPEKKAEPAPPPEPLQEHTIYSRGRGPYDYPG